MEPDADLIEELKKKFPLTSREPMNDEQILRKLAEIEGLRSPTFHERMGIGYAPDLSPDGVALDVMLWFNPLDSWLCCGPLQESHDVWTESDGDGWHGICDGCHSTDPDLKRAICLAIIESKAHSEQHAS